jgi:UDP-N-acetylmuramoylalanine--D-glutamate ligase
MGLGRFGGGVGSARWYAEHGHDVLVTDGKTEDQLAESVDALRPLGVRFRLGGHDPADFDEAEIVVVNPAIPFDSPLVARARAGGAALATEMGMTLRLWPGPVVAITGTNGKSTTAGLTAAMVGAAGIPVVLGGNIGKSLLNECESASPDNVAVLEISSFQLAWMEHDDWHPQVAIVTNITGDHLDRHGTFEHYRDSKRRLAEVLSSDGVLILPRDNAVAGGFAEQTAARVEWFGGDEPDPVDLSGLKLVGRHNHANACAAARAALAVGATPAACAAGAAAFPTLPHRLESLGEKRGVLLINDSVCTTPEATAAAVRSFSRPVVLLTGGRDKGLSWGPLLAAAREAHAVVAYGETGPRLRSELPDARLEADFSSAVRRGLELARPGDVLLLSPGFASYDEFAGFDMRGRRFRELLQ